MVRDRRVTFVRKWLRRASEAEDEFDRFFAAWVALVVAARRLRDFLGWPRRGRDSDRQHVIDYFLAKKAEVMNVVKKHRAEMMWLARRRGTTHRGLIIDTGNRNLRELFDRLSRHYTAGQPMEDDEHVTAIAELLNKIRNNLFHGGKVYDDKEDLELLRKVNPLLLAVLKESERDAG